MICFIDASLNIRIAFLQRKEKKHKLKMAIKYHNFTHIKHGTDRFEAKI